MIIRFDNAVIDLSEFYFWDMFECHLGHLKYLLIGYSKDGRKYTFRNENATAIWEKVKEADERIFDKLQYEVTSTVDDNNNNSNYGHSYYDHQ